MSQGIQVTKANLEIFSGLEKWGILGLGQIKGCLSNKGLTDQKRTELFFNSTEHKDWKGTAYKTMLRLEKGGYVRGHSYTNLPRVYTLTGKGHAELRKNSMNRQPGFYGNVAETLVRHELLVTGVGLVLSELRGLEVTTETERYLISDTSAETMRKQGLGLSDLWIADRRQPKAVEIERTQKSAARYAELWSDYRKKLPPSGVVLYIACFTGGEKILLRRAEKLRADHVYVCGLDRFRESLGRGPFVGFRGGRVELGETAVPQPAPAPARLIEEPASAGPRPLLARPEFRATTDWRPR